MATRLAEVGDRVASTLPPVAKVVDGSIDDWVGESPLIGGTSVVDRGEFIYQDFIYDDTGPKVGTQTNTAGAARAKTNGTYRYPTAMSRYRSNAADLFQFRAAESEGRAHFLVLLNTLLEPDTTVVGIAIGQAGSPATAWPLGAQLSTPADHVLTAWGTGGQFDEQPLAAVGGEIAVDIDSNAIEVSLPLSLVGSSFRTYVATGLWSGAGWMSVGASRGAAAAGGGDGAHPNVFNVAFRNGETTIPDGATWQDGNFWFEREQAAALTAGDIDGWFAEIDLVSADRPLLRPTGLQQMIHRAAATPAPHEGFLEHGVSGNNEDPLNTGRGRGCSLATLPLPSCSAFSVVGPWQPYAVYIPPGGFDRIAVLLHGGTYNLNYTLVRRIQQQLGDDAGALLVEPVGMGPSSWFTDESHLEVLESIKDAQRRFNVDSSRTVIGGISMGGYGANRLLVTNPDLFAGGILWSAAPGDVTHNYGGNRYEEVAEPGNGNPGDLLENHRNHNLFVIHAYGDQSAYYAIMAAQLRRLDELGYAHEVHSHLTWQHTTVFTVNQWSRESNFIGGMTGDSDPAHVTFSTSEAWWAPQISDGLVFDKAYWLSGLRVRDTSKGFGSKGTVDAVSQGLGKSEPETEKIPERFVNGDPAPHTVTGRRGVASAAIPVANRFAAALTNVASVAFDLGRMNVTTATDFAAEFTTDGPTVVRLRGAAPSTIDGGGATVTRDGDDVVLEFSEPGRYLVSVGNAPPGPGDDEGAPPRGEPGLTDDCAVTRDPGPQSFEVLPPTGNGGTNVTSGDNRVRLSSPGTQSYYVVEVGPTGVHAYGRRDGSTELGEPNRLEAHEITLGPDPWVCAAVPALGVGVQG